MTRTVPRPGYLYEAGKTIESDISAAHPKRFLNCLPRIHGITCGETFMHSVCDRLPAPVADETRPIVIYLNHASWWDPLVCLYLARRFFRDWTSVAPIEAECSIVMPSLSILGFIR